jgi:hypothetical protein
VIAETGLLGLLLLVAFLAYALVAIRSKERARSVVHEYCHRQGLVLLDDTVVLKRLSIQRSSDGRIALRRRYRFEFTSDGELRYSGEVVLSGRHVLSITADAYRWSPKA